MYIRKDGVSVMIFFRMVLENKTVYHIPDDGRDENESFSIKRRRISKLSPKIITSLHFWCLNPAVVRFIFL